MRAETEEPEFDPLYVDTVVPRSETTLGVRDELSVSGGRELVAIESL